MAKVVKMTTGAFAVYCPACKCYHGMDSRWEFNGSLDKPTFRPSVLSKRPPNHVCHSFITNGRIAYLPDCTHEYAGLTVDITDEEGNTT